MQLEIEDGTMKGRTPFPSLFVAHGSPMLALDGEAWGEALKALGREFPQPRAILVCSAHWEAAGPFLLSSAEVPGVMHDFGGFPEALYSLDYPAPGSPALAWEARDLLQKAGLESTLDPARPLDHGAWVPLKYLAPDATVPVVQLSLPRTRTPALLLAAGRALAPLRRQGVLMLGSGGIVHNLRRLDWHGDSAPQPWATSFQAWIGERLVAGDASSLMDWQKAPGAMESVPTSEHLDPLFITLGAADGPPESIYEGWQLGSLSLTSYQFP